MYSAKALCILGIAFGLVAAVCGSIAIAKMNRRSIVVPLVKSFPMKGIVGITLGIVGTTLSEWLLITLF